MNLTNFAKTDVHAAIYATSFEAVGKQILLILIIYY